MIVGYLDEDDAFVELGRTAVRPYRDLGDSRLTEASVVADLLQPLIQPLEEPRLRLGPDRYLGQRYFQAPQSPSPGHRAARGIGG